MSQLLTNISSNISSSLYILIPKGIEVLETYKHFENDGSPFKSVITMSNSKPFPQLLDFFPKQ